jgi:hypothetical protein
MVPPRAVRQNPARLLDFQATLDRLGVLRRWPTFDALRPGSRRGYRPPAQ